MDEPASKKARIETEIAVEEEVQQMGPHKVVDDEDDQDTQPTDV